MKFLQLRPGTRFRYQDRVFRKTSPLKATDEADGTQRLIPRSAQVTALDEAGSEQASQLPETLPASAVEDALAALTDAVRLAVEQAEPPLGDEESARLIQSVERAKLAILARLADSR